MQMLAKIHKENCKFLSEYANIWRLAYTEGNKTNRQNITSR